MKIIYFTLIASLMLFATSYAVPPRQNFNHQRRPDLFQRQLTPPIIFPAGGQPKQPPPSLPRNGQPPSVYGPPSPQPETTTNYQDSTTINIEAESILSDRRKNEKQIDSTPFKNTDQGFYYVYLPDGRLQRVIYMTSADLQNMAYTARVRYEDVDPVAAPIYSTVNKVQALPRQRIIVEEIQ